MLVYPKDAVIYYTQFMTASEAALSHKANGSGGIRTRASEETGSLNQRLN